MELSVRTVYAAKTASAKKTRLNMLEDMEDLTNQNNLFMLKEDLKVQKAVGIFTGFCQKNIGLAHTDIAINGF